MRSHGGILDGGATASDTFVWGDANVGLYGLYGESSYYDSNGLQSNAEAWAMGYANAFYACSRMRGC